MAFHLSPLQGCQMLLGKTYQNGEKIYTMTTELTIWPQNIPNDHKIYQHYTFQGPPKYAQIAFLA
jgi:hypothetical protein